MWANGVCVGDTEHRDKWKSRIRVVAPNCWDKAKEKMEKKKKKKNH